MANKSEDLVQMLKRLGYRPTLSGELPKSCQIITKAKKLKLLRLETAKKVLKQEYMT
jgi:hypothetical protein